MFKPDENQSKQTLALLQTVFNNEVENAANYTVVYGYYAKTGLLAKKLYHFAVGFNAANKEMVVIPLNANGTAGAAPICLNAGNIQSAKVGIQGDVIIKSAALGNDLRMMVLPYTATQLTAMGILPVIQEQEAAQFIEMIKAI